MAKGRKVKTGTGKKIRLPFAGAKMPFKSGGGRHTRKK